MLLGEHCINGYSSTQATIPLSSGEAELYALALGMQKVMRDAWISIGSKVKVVTDASAARGMQVQGHSEFLTKTADQDFLRFRPHCRIRVIGILRNVSRTYTLDSGSSDSQSDTANPV